MLRHLPNLLTALRLIVAPCILYLLWQKAYALAAVCLLLAVASDALDGFLARRFRWQSELGGILDPLADKLLMGMSFIGLSISHQVPLWLLILVLARDVLIVSGALAYRALIGPFSAEPSLWGKTSTVLQSLFVLATVFALGWRWPLSPWFAYAVWIVALVVVVSGADYVWRWSHRAVWHARAKGEPRKGVARDDH